MSSNQPQRKTDAPPLLYDQSLLQKRISADKLAHLPFAKDLAEEIALRLHPVKRRFEKALLLYPPCPLEEALRDTGKVDTIDTRNITALPAAADNLELEPAQYDLIVTCLGLQYANDLPGALIQLRRALKPGGLLLGCLAGGETLADLRTAFAETETKMTGGVSPRVHPSIDIKQIGSLLQRATFADPIIDIEKYTLLYPSVFDMFYELRRWGGNLMAARSKRFAPRALMHKLAAHYETLSAQNDKIAAQVELIWFSAWVKHDGIAGK